MPRGHGDNTTYMTYLSYLVNYPYPAFITNASKEAGKLGLDLNPTWANKPFREFICGDANSDITDAKKLLLGSFGTSEDVKIFMLWLEGKGVGVESNATCKVNLCPTWLSSISPESKGHELVFVKTLVDAHLVITSIPSTHSTLPTPPRSPVLLSPTRKAPGLKLSDLPHHSLPADAPTFLRERQFSEPPPNAGSCRSLTLSFDWTSVGMPPYSQWPQSLQSLVSYVFASPFPKALWWGPEVVLIYNDHYANMIGNKHPAAFGLRGRESWGELWAGIGSLVHKVLGGEAIAKVDDLLFFNMLGPQLLPCETYHSWSWVPVWKEGDEVGGMLNAVFETTPKVISARRMSALQRLGERSAECRNKEEFVKAVMDSLSNISVDVPFAAFYSCAISNGSEESTSTPFMPSSAIEGTPVAQHTEASLTLLSSFGVPRSHPYIPHSVNLSLDDKTNIKTAPSNITFFNRSHTSPGFTSPSLRHDNDIPSTGSSETLPDRSADTVTTASILGTNQFNTITPTKSSGSSSGSTTSSTPFHFTWPFATVFTTKQTLHITSLPPQVVDHIEKLGWEDPVRDALVVPIIGEEERVVAVLILGCNTRRPYDEDYATWIDVLRSSVANGLTSAISRSVEIQRVQELQSLDAAKTMFFSNASHELRTPLTLISGPIDDCISRIEDARAKDLLKLAQRNVSRLGRIVDALMDFARLEGGRLHGKFRRMNLSAFTSDLATLFRPTIERSSIEYITNFEAKGPICFVDPDFWEKICFNLIGNAFKYTMSGTIVVSMEYTETHCVLTVSDTGMGIPLSDINKIGERFHRVQSVAASRSHEGTGIGLSLTTELIKLHGGHLSIQSCTEEESEDGSHGSTFMVSIPLGKEHIPGEYLDSQPATEIDCGKYGRGIIDEAGLWMRPAINDLTPASDSGSGSGGSSSEGSRMDPNTMFFSKQDILLLVEDNTEMRAYIKMMFSQFCRVIEASDGEVAVNLMKTIRPDVIITDAVMPVMDGYGLLAAVRGNPASKLIPVILLTAQAGDDSRVEGLLKGFDDYVTKPFKGRELVARVHLQMQLGKRRAQLEAAFEVQTQEIKLLSEVSPVGMFRADNSGHIIYANPRWYEFTGHTESDNIDAWATNVHPDDLNSVMDAWKVAVEEQSPTSIEFRWISQKWTKGQFEPLMSKEGKFIGVLGTITDISDRRLFEAAQLAHAQELEVSARKRAEEAEFRRHEADERRRGQELLIDVTSHELRQPVSAIINCSALVRSNIASLRTRLLESKEHSHNFTPSQELLDVMDEDLEALDAIYQCGLAQERIANDVLSLSRIQLQILSIHPVEFELVVEVQRILGIFRNEVKMKKITLSLVVDESVSALSMHRIKSDKSRFAQVVTNLLSNAIKFTDTSTNVRMIQVTLAVAFEGPQKGCHPPAVHSPLSASSDFEEREVFVYVAVQDSGPGVQPDDLARLFKRFGQGSNSHDVFGGSGLGLFVSRQLCELMGGRIDVESVYGEGATFRFFIRALTAPSNDPAALMANEELLGIDNAKEGVKSGMTILVTEDNLINQTVLNRQLIKEGCKTVLASNGLQAIEQIKSRARRLPAADQFTAVLMDCEMPVMDGLTATEEIRRLEGLGELPNRNWIIALTGNAREGQIESAREAGMDNVVIKPYRIAELMKLLARGRIVTPPLPPQHQQQQQLEQLSGDLR